jgi:hypothetical protein
MNGQKEQSALTREHILAALRALSDQLEKQGVTGEICACHEMHGSAHREREG